MKNIILYLILIVFISVSCKTEEDSSDGGYSCIDGSCTANFNNPDYLTLEDCMSLCGNSQSNNNTNNNSGNVTNTSPGKVTITATWIRKYVACDPGYIVTIGLGYSSSDVANQAFFATSGNDSYPPASYSKQLEPGTYYYSVKKTYKMYCGTGQGVPPDVVKNGAFTITGGNTTTINAGYLD